jgi:uncharacterized membrane protein (DUF2068 family)
MSVTDRSTPKSAAGLYTIIAIKLGKSLLLLCIALGVYSLLDNDLPAELERFLRWVRIDPEHAFFTSLGERLQSVTPANSRFFASGTLLYGLLLLVESAGLMRRTFWAAWLAIGETAFFIPIEIFELVRGASHTILVILLANVLIVWYLLRNRARLFHHGG